MPEQQPDPNKGLAGKYPRAVSLAESVFEALLGAVGVGGDDAAPANQVGQMLGAALPLGAPLRAARALKPAAAAKTAALDMGEAARMKRAAEQGFKVDAFHATDKDFSAFAPQGSGARGFHFGIGEPSSANARHEVIERADAPGLNVMPLKVRMDAPAQLKDKGMAGGRQMVDQLGKKYPDRVTAQLRKEFRTELERQSPPFVKDPTGNYVPWTDEQRKVASEVETRLMDQLLTKAGFDGIQYVNRWEAPGSMSGVVFNPTQLRSKFAAFDPSKKDSGNLLSSLVLALLGGGAAASVARGEK